MTWALRSLDSLLDKSGSDRAGKRNYPVLSTTMRDGLVDQSEKFKKRVASQDTSKYRIAYRNELVVGFPIDEGVLGFQTKYPAGIVSPAYDIWKLRAPGDTYIPYLERYLRSTQARRTYASKMQGAVARRRRLTKDDFLEFAIPFPPLDDQKRIAHLLGKAEGLITRRKQQLQQLDDLLKSFFLNFFGDPVRNEKGWDKTELKYFGKISTGNTPPRKDASNYSSRHIEWIKTDNISTDSVFISSAAEYLSETGARKARTVTSGALLVACIAGSIKSIGRASLTDRTVAFNQQINAIQPNASVNPLFLHILFMISRKYIQSHASKGMKKILSKGDFEKILMIKPPVELQNQFGSIVEKVIDIKSNYQNSLTDLEDLFGSLSQKAFKGELDLSRVPLPTEGRHIAGEVKIDEDEAQSAEPSFKLPAPEDIKVLNSNEGRKTLLGEWLNAWLVHIGDAPFSAQEFMETAQQRVWELAEDEATEWGLSEYDELKRWVFHQIRQGRIKQTRNIVLMNEKRKFGNDLILRVRKSKLQ